MELILIHGTTTAMGRSEICWTRSHLESFSVGEK